MEYESFFQEFKIVFSLLFSQCGISQFGHDQSDHLGGFWKLIRRGQTRRFREIDLGHVDPLGEGTRADIRIAGLGLQVGDRLKYVYDFGDWIEHEIIVENVVLPQDSTSESR